MIGRNMICTLFVYALAAPILILLAPSRGTAHDFSLITARPPFQAFIDDVARMPDQCVSNKQGMSTHSLPSDQINIEQYYNAINYYTLCDETCSIALAFIKNKAERISALKRISLEKAYDTMGNEASERYNACHEPYDLGIKTEKNFRG